MKKALKIFIIAILALFVLFTPFYFTFNMINPHLTVRKLGFKPYIVLTRSMEPILNVGDMIIATKKNLSDVQVGDIIAFKTKKDYVVAHYVAKKYYGDNLRILIRTKPNNLKADVDVDSENLDKWIISEQEYIGVINYSIPKIGHIFLFFQTKIGILTIFSVVIVLLMSRFIIGNIFIEEELYARDTVYGLRPQRIKRDSLKDENKKDDKDSGDRN